MAVSTNSRQLTHLRASTTTSREDCTCNPAMSHSTTPAHTATNWMNNSSTRNSSCYTSTHTMIGNLSPNMTCTKGLLRIYTARCHHNDSNLLLRSPQLCHPRSHSQRVSIATSLAFSVHQARPQQCRQQIVSKSMQEHLPQQHQRRTHMGRVVKCLKPAVSQQAPPLQLEAAPQGSLVGRMGSKTHHPLAKSEHQPTTLSESSTTNARVIDDTPGGAPAW